MPDRLRPLALAILFLGLAVTVHAGTLCGTVRDSQSMQPVPLAGVFLYQSSAYTGLHGATDGAGEFCIGQVPPGTYDLSVRVDGFETAWLNGVVVEDDATAVDLFSGVPAELDAPWPNPASAQVFFRYRLGTANQVRLVVYDQRGRVVRGWEGDAHAGEAVLSWDFRDLTGRPVASGIYFIRMHVGDRVLTRSLARVR